MKGLKGLAGGLGNMQGLMQQAQKMQEQLHKTQAELEVYTIEGHSGGGAVKVVLNGKYQCVSLEISKEAIDPNDQEVLQEMVQAAFNDASSKIQEHTKSELSKVTGGLSIPGLF